MELSQSQICMSVLLAYLVGNYNPSAFYSWRGKKFSFHGFQFRNSAKMVKGGGADTNGQHEAQRANLL